MSTTALVANNLPISNLPTIGAIGTLDAYVSAVHQIPVLSLDEEQALARSFRGENDLDAAKKLVMSHLRFVVHVARSYNGYGLQVGDLIQEGNIGLMKAVKRFDPDVGVRLVSFAVHWIRAEMHEFILRNWRIVKIATTKAQRKLFFNLRKSKKRLGWMNSREVQAVAKDLGVTVADVLEMESRLSGHDMAFDKPQDADDDEKPSPGAYLVDNAADPYQTLEASNQEDSDLGYLKQGLSKLDARSRDIIQRRWLRDGDKSTLQELADEYGVSAERIRQVEVNAMKKMRTLFAA